MGLAIVTDGGVVRGLVIVAEVGPSRGVSYEVCSLHHPYHPPRCGRAIARASPSSLQRGVSCEALSSLQSHPGCRPHCPCHCERAVAWGFVAVVPQGLPRSSSLSLSLSQRGSGPMLLPCESSVEPLCDDDDVGCVPVSSSSCRGSGLSSCCEGVCVPIVMGVKGCLRAIDRPKFISAILSDAAL